MGAKYLANLTAFNYSTLNNTSKIYEITSVIETGKPVKVIPVINGLLTGATPSQVAIYTVNRKDGASLSSSVSIDSDGKITVVDTFTVAGNGIYVVTATAKSGTDYMGTKSVEVEFALQFNFVDSVVVNSGTDIMIEWGDSPTTLSVDVVAQGNAATGVTWTSATPTVASVDVNSGELTILKVGTTDITAISTEDTTKSNDITVMVGKKVTGLSISYKALTTVQWRD